MNVEIHFCRNIDVYNLHFKRGFKQEMLFLIMINPEERNSKEVFEIVAESDRAILEIKTYFKQLLESNSGGLKQR